MSPDYQRDHPMEKQVQQQQNIQEAFLNNARKEKIYLTIYLMSGVKLSGRIKSFDKYSVILEANNQEQLIFKHAISTVVVSRTTAHSGMHVAAQANHASGPHPVPGAPPPIEAGER
jgi:host factor-I protein